MITGWANAHQVTAVAHPVIRFCPTSSTTCASTSLRPSLEPPSFLHPSYLGDAKHRQLSPLGSGVASDHLELSQAPQPGAVMLPPSQPESVPAVSQPPSQRGAVELPPSQHEDANLPPSVCPSLEPCQHLGLHSSLEPSGLNPGPQSHPRAANLPRSSLKQLS